MGAFGLYLLSHSHGASGEVDCPSIIGNAVVLKRHVAGGNERTTSRATNDTSIVHSSVATRARVQVRVIVPLLLPVPLSVSCKEEMLSILRDPQP